MHSCSNPLVDHVDEKSQQNMLPPSKQDCWKQFLIGPVVS